MLVRFVTRHARWLLPSIVLFIPIALHAHLLLGVLVTDPEFLYGGFSEITRQPIPGYATTDPNIGYVDQALTATAMRDIFAGHWPWWNSLEGFGAPLAGEMQCSAFFPFAVLLLLPNGMLLMNVLMQMLAGIAMLVLLRRVGLSPWASLVGAIAYESCGTFAWLSGVWSYSLPWLPFLLLGIEQLRVPGRKAMLGGTLIVAGALYALISAGFVEIAYLQGLVGIGWALVRLGAVSKPERGQCVRRLLVAAGLGFALAAPIIVAFIDTLRISFVAEHVGTIGAKALVPWAFVQKMLPYIYGPIAASHEESVKAAFNVTGGYLGVALSVAAVLGMFGDRLRPLRALGTVVVVLGLGATMGIPPLHQILLLVPGVKYTATFRLLDPCIEFAAALLAALAVDDVLENARNVARHWKVAIAVVPGAIALSLIWAWPSIAGQAVDGNRVVWEYLFSFVEVGAVIAAFGLALRAADPAVRAGILGGAIAFEAATLMFVATLSYPAHVNPSFGGIAFLRAHLGEHRFYTLGPLAPNYGSYFGIAELNYNDLPVPWATVAYIHSRLDPKADSVTFTGDFPRSGQSPEEDLIERARAFAGAGVKYVLTPTRIRLKSPEFVPAYSDARMRIYALGSPAAYFSAPGCLVRSGSRDSATADCKKPSVLCRLELNEPGWTATRNGAIASVATCGGIFQAVTVPAGASAIRYDYAPPNIGYALAIAVLAFAGLTIAAVLLALRALPGTLRRLGSFEG